MGIVLVPYWIAEECYLSEALMWAAFQRYPKSEIIPDRVDMRFDHDYQEEYEPNIPDWHGYIESEEAERVGLPPNPEWEALFENDDNMKLLQSNPEQYFAEEAKKREAQAEKQEEWNGLYEAYIERIQSRFFNALGDGELKAYGRKLPHPDLGKAVEMMDEKGSWSWFDIEHEEIPSDFWRLQHIDWNQSAAENGKAHYCHIYLKTENVMSIFPAPETEDTQTVSVIAGQYVPYDGQVPRKANIGKRGRPAYDWESFHLEMARLVKAGDLPKKQEAIIPTMQAWCREKWGKEPGRSTLIEKISPYYGMFVRN